MRSQQRRIYSVVNSNETVSGGRTFFDIYTNEEAVRSYFSAQYQFLHSYPIIRPSLHWPLEVTSPDGGRVRVPKLIVAFALSGEDVGPMKGLYADPVVSVADHWCPSRPAQ